MMSKMTFFRNQPSKDLNQGPQGLIESIQVPQELHRNEAIINSIDPIWRKNYWIESIHLSDTWNIKQLLTDMMLCIQDHHQRGEDFNQT